MSPRWCDEHPEHRAHRCPGCAADHVSGEHTGRPTYTCHRCRHEQRQADELARITDARRRQANDTEETP